MSSRSWEELPNGDRLYHFWCGGTGWELQVIRIKRTGGFQFNIEWNEPVSNHQDERRRSADAYAHNDNLEGLRAFLTEDIKDHFIQENTRLHNLLQGIKHRAKFQEDREMPPADWVCANVSDKDAGW